MKTTILSAFLFLASQCCFAQWTEAELKPYKEKAEKAIKEYINKMVQSGKWDKDDDALKIDFATDTMRIERVVGLLEADGRYSTMEMHFTLTFQLEEYDKLLNKYYKLLMGKLTDEDKAKVKEAQRTWLKYRDSEAKINNEIISPNKYTGGGTMWPLVGSGRTLDIVKERVFSLYHFITCI